MILNFKKPLEFGTIEYENKIREIESEKKKQEGFTHSVRHNCSIIHWIKNKEPSQEEQDHIENTCPCKEGKKLVLCPNGHSQRAKFDTVFIKSCPTCVSLMNEWASRWESPQMEEKRKRDAEDNRRYQEVQDQIKARKEEAEAQRIAKLELRVEELKKELRDVQKK